MEASKEVARQLRLRDLSGLVVIDFIDMKNESNRKKIYYELRKELKKDRAKVAVSPISDFGLLEMTRQRIRLSLLDSMSDECPEIRRDEFKFLDSKNNGKVIEHVSIEQR